MEVIDNFLPEEVYQDLVNNICFQSRVPLHFQQTVSHPQGMDTNTELWNWYAIHNFYTNHRPVSEYYDNIMNIFQNSLPNFQSLLRIKLNFYPHTETLREHGQHVDYDFPNHAAIYSLNTCDGFTRLSDGTKIDSVGNRMLFLDGFSLHNSSTTTNAKGRYNINFNYL